MAKRSIQPHVNGGQGGPKKLSNLIADVLIRRGYARQAAASQFQDAWQAATEPGLSRVSRPGRLVRGVLEVTVANSTVMQELTFRQQQILASLNRDLEYEIHRLRFKLGPID